MLAMVLATAASCSSSLSSSTTGSAMSCNGVGGKEAPACRWNPHVLLVAGRLALGTAMRGGQGVLGPAEDAVGMRGGRTVEAGLEEELPPPQLLATMASGGETSKVLIAASRASGKRSIVAIASL